MINGGSSSKAAAPPAEGNGGFQAQHKMAVVPPKKEDLQRSYARVVEDNVTPDGWYARMST